MGKNWMFRVVVAATLGGFGGVLGCGGDMPKDGGGAQPDLSIVAKGDLAMPPGDMPKTEDDLAVGDMEIPDAAEGDLTVEGDMAAPDDGAALPDGANDLSDPPCGNSQQSCGKPGNCEDCTGKTVGVACVAMKCGCNSSADCPKGSACNLQTNQCSDSCAGGLVCNGGCCDGQTCQSGSDVATCGSDGNKCAACGLGTPTCVGGACSATCVVGMGMVGNCGQGFCCNAQNQCAAIANASCGVAGAACTDCGKSANGPTCLMNGSCGCAVSKDCPVGQACKGGACGTACDMNTACNGGCCSQNVCVAGNTQTGCSLGGAVCGSCAGNGTGTACVTLNAMTFCGCDSQNDCPANSACNTTTHKCGAACDVNNPCNGGCCSAAMNGTCAKGVADAACGNNGGVCASCAANDVGRACVATQGGGTCGCDPAKVLADCPITATKCDAVKKICIKVCSAIDKCQFGCCSAAMNGECRTGTAHNTCGGAGICVDCTIANVGHVCRPGANNQNTCGCNAAADCPSNQACNVVNHSCTATCSMAQACNGGCCSNPAGGTCQPGNVVAACGAANACLNCTNAAVGRACVSGACGCTKASDCGALQACDAVKKVCTNICNANQLCNGGCCSGGVCVAGTANSACGGAGAACIGCQAGTPSCVANACVNKCGAGNDGICGFGFCCSALKCVIGNQSKACGYSGACMDCSNNSDGTKCQTPVNNQYFCGCDDQTQCLPANPQGGSAGYTCAKSDKTCTSLCGNPALFTNCNGGCCSAPNGQCRAGGGDAACGNGGGFCKSCSASCNPGPTCINGGCGCNNLFSQCFNEPTCYDPPGHRDGCNLATASCCVSGLNGFKDNGNAANCCTGASVNGLCTCNLAGGAAGNPPSPWFCCSVLLNNMGQCGCRNNGASVNLLGFGAEPKACCSGRVTGSTCVCSAKGQTAQTQAGCCANLVLANGMCN